jgi:PPP family 3-phenylpropionic acid transporter
MCRRSANTLIWCGASSPPDAALSALGQSIYYALGTGATQAVIYQFSGLLYQHFGQRAFLGMTAVSAVGTLAIVMLARLWDGGLVVGMVPASASGRAR